MTETKPHFETRSVVFHTHLVLRSAEGASRRTLQCGSRILERPSRRHASRGPQDEAG